MNPADRQLVAVALGALIALAGTVVADLLRERRARSATRITRHTDTPRGPEGPR